VDVDEHAGSYILVVLSCDYGTLTLSPAAGLRFVSGETDVWAGDVSFSGTASFYAGLSTANGALGAMTYLANQDWHGNDTLTVVADDRGWSTEASTGDRPGLTSNHSLTIVVNPLPDRPSWSAPPFPLMAAEDEALPVAGVSVTDADDETYLRVDVWAENGRVGLPRAANSSSSLKVEEGIGNDGEGDGAFALTGDEVAVNLALTGLVYYPPPDWTSFKQADGIHLSAEDPSGLSSHVRLVVVVASGRNDPPQVHVPGATYVEEPCDSQSGKIGLPSPQHPPAIGRQCRRITTVDRIQTNEDETLAIEGVYIEDADFHEAGPGAQIDVDVEAQHGSLGFTGMAGSPPTGILFLPDGERQQGERLLSMRGALASVNAALARLTYAPDPDWSGSDEVEVRVNDRGFTGSGGAGTDSRGIPIDVAPQQDAPLLLVTATGAAGAGATAPPPPLDIWEDARVVLHNVTLYDADVNPRELHRQIFGISSRTPYDDYPADVFGGMFQVTVKVDNGRVFFPRSAGLAFEPATAVSFEQSAVDGSAGQSMAPFIQGATFAPSTLDNLTTAVATNETVGPGALHVPWWREARFTGRLHDCNDALGAMTYWPDVNWNGVDRVHVSVIESSPDRAASGGGSSSGSSSSSQDNDNNKPPGPDVAAEVSMFVRVAAVNDAPVVTPPSPQWHSTLRTGDLLSPAARYGSRVFVAEDSELLLPGFVIRDVDLAEGGGESAMVTVTVTCGHGTASITWHGVRAGMGPGDSRHPQEQNSLGADLSGLLFRNEVTGDWAPWEGESMGEGRKSFTFRTPLADANAALQTLAFRPMDNYFGGGAWVRVEAHDEGFSGQGSIGSATSAAAGQSPQSGAATGYTGVSSLRGAATVPITVLAVNDPPSIQLPYAEDGNVILRIDEGEERRLDGARWRGSFAAAVQASAYFPNRKGIELWKSQGVFPGRDAGRWGRGSELEWREALVLDLNEGLGDGSPRHFVGWGGYLYFQATDAEHGAELWRTDGTGAGTVLVKDIYPGERSGSPTSLTAFGDYLYFQANGLDVGWMLPSDYHDLCGGFRQSSFDSTVFFAVSEENEWDPDIRYDCPDGFHHASTAQGFALFTGTQDDDREAASMEPTVYFGQCGWDGYTWGERSRMYFRFSDSGRTGAYKHAGRRDSYRPGIDNDDMGDPTAGFAGIVCVDSEQAASHLSTTTAATERGSLAPGACRWGERANTGCYSRAGVELWRTDGSAKGTRRVDDLRSGVSGSFPSYLTVFDGALFYAAHTDLTGMEMFRSDGTSGGASIVEDIVRGHQGSNPMDLVAASGTALFFTADDGIAGRELWRSDGALGFQDARPELGFRVTGGSGTRRVKDARPGKLGSEPLHLTWEPTRSVLFFSADDGLYGRELWSSDGTTAGTAIVADICPGVRGSGPSHLIAWGGAVYFQADDCSTGPELWVSDGSEGGTLLLADVRPGSAGAFPSYLTLLEPTAGGGERLFFLANGGGYDAAAAAGLAQGWGGSQLWVTDGTGKGTQRAFGQKTAGDFMPDRVSLDAGRPPRMAAFNGALYLPATEDPLVAVETLLGMHEASEEGVSQAMVIYDIDGGPESVLGVTIECDEGELIVGDGAGLLFDNSDEAAIDDQAGDQSLPPPPSGVLRFNGTAADINRAMRDLRYRGLPGRAGQDAIRITVTDDPDPCPGDYNVSSSGFNATTSAGVNATARRVERAPCALGGPQATERRIQVYLSAVNRPPSVNVPQGTLRTVVDAAQAIGVGAGGALSVEDPDVRETVYHSAGGLRIEGPVSVAVVCASGRLSLGARAGLSFSEGEGVSDPVLRFGGAIDDANRALATLSYHCSSLYDCVAGMHEISVTVDDNGFTGKGGALSANATFSVTVDEPVE
ncbi:unnamed protein product, partial [Ectocarpus fasciculatus]